MKKNSCLKGQFHSTTVYYEVNSFTNLGSIGRQCHEASASSWIAATLNFKEQPMPRAKSPRNGEAKVKNITPITAGLTPEMKKATSVMAVEDEIRVRAYELYEERGRMPGFEHEDWLRAEHEVLSRRSQQSA
jgi:hypothetical protein